MREPRNTRTGYVGCDVARAKRMSLRIFISSVQKEFAEERRLLKRYISKNPVYRRFFDTFVFEEDVVAADRRTDEVYLEELGKCDIYIGLIGREYGFEDAEGVSPTEREFDEATRLGEEDFHVVDSREVFRSCTVIVGDICEP